jgi:hypothetical protein
LKSSLGNPSPVGILADEVEISEELIGLTYLIGILTAFIAPMIIWFWSRRRIALKKRQFLDELGSQLGDEGTFTFRSPAAFRFGALIFAECLVICGTGFLVPAFHGTFGEIDPDYTTVHLSLWRTILVFVQAALSFTLPWLIVIPSFSKVVVANYRGIAASSAFRKDICVLWAEVDKADFGNSRGFSSHTLFTAKGKIGLNWESSEWFSEFLALAEANIPRDNIIPDKRIYAPFGGVYERPSDSETAPTIEPGSTPKQSKVVELIRSNRMALHRIGLTALAAGLLLDVVGVMYDLEPLIYLGMSLPVIGSVLLLASLASATGVRVKTHKEAEDEAGLGIIFYGYLGVCVIALIILAPSIMENIESRETDLYVVTPHVTDVFRIEGIAFVLYFAFIVGAILLSFYAITKHSLVTYLKILRGEEVDAEACDNNQFFGNPLTSIFYIFMTNLFVSVAFFIIIKAAGINPTMPDLDIDLWKLAYVMANASVWEEVTTRVLLLGVPLLAVNALFRRDRMGRPWKYILGGNIEFGVVECGLALFSSLMFGLAHVGLWDFYKVFPTTIMGLFFAYLFMKFGLYAAIILHFTIDFYDIPLVMIDRSYSGTILVVFLLFGLIAFLVYTKALLKFIANRLMKGQEETVASPT